LKDLGGAELVKHYKSMHKLLSSVYPEHKWVLFQFSIVPNASWEEVFRGTFYSHFFLIFVDPQSKLAYVKYLESQLGIENQEQWNTVSFLNLQKVKTPPSWK
jgi:hypothetical protein